MSNRRDDPSFEELMAMEGVMPLEDRQRGRRGGKIDTVRAAPRKPRSAPPETGNTRPRGMTSLGDVVRAREPIELPREAVPEAEPPPAPAPQHDGRLQEALEATRARAAQAEAQVTELRAALDRARADSQSLDTERRQLHEQCRRLRAELARAQDAAARRVPVSEILEARGLDGIDEVVTALVGLLQTRPQELLDAIHLAEPEHLARLLDQRVALVHDDGGTGLGADCVIVPVAPERCEITGGSDIRGAFRRLLDACRTTDTHEITIVGGSPAYRQQLKELADPHRTALRLNLVSGTQRRTRRRAAADMRKSDLVVIWGATELDHSVSAVYTGDEAPILRVPHRGISRMLDQVAISVQSRRA